MGVSTPQFGQPTQAAPDRRGVSNTEVLDHHASPGQRIPRVLRGHRSLDIGTAGWDVATGAGIAMAPDALRAVLSPLTLAGSGCMLTGAGSSGVAERQRATPNGSMLAHGVAASAPSGRGDGDSLRVPGGVPCAKGGSSRDTADRE